MFLVRHARALAALLPLFILMAARPAAAETVEFPKDKFETCLNRPVNECKVFLHNTWTESRKNADEACHKRTFSVNSTERFICSFLFGNTTTNVLPKKESCEKEIKEKDELAEQLKQCKSEKGAANCDDATAELKKKLKSCEDDKNQLKSSLDDANNQLAGAKKDLDSCKSDLQAAHDEAGKEHLGNAQHVGYGTHIRVGFAWVLGFASEPALALGISHRLVGTKNLDFNVVLSAVNFYQGNKGGALVGGGAELNWFPTRNDKFEWGFGGQVMYAALVVESPTANRYSNGVWFGGHLMMDWTVHPAWALGFRVNASAVGEVGAKFGGVVGIDFVVVHRSLEAL